MRFRGLDALRGICALAVILFHVENLARIFAGHLHGVGFVDHSFLFVDFFFVLSGFVIAHSYFGRLPEAADIGGFVIRRFGRVYPLHLVVLIGFIAIELVKLFMVSQGGTMESQPFTGFYSVPAILTNLLLIQAFGLHDTGTWNSPSWSISVEFYTYIIFAIFAYFAGKQRFLAISTAAFIAGASAIILAACSKYYIDAVYDYAIFRCLYGFFGGVLAHFLFAACLRGRTIGPWLGSGLELLAMTVVIMFVDRVGSDPVSLAVPLVFLGAVLVFALEAGLISRLLVTGPLQLLGRLSYTTYITHALVLLVVVRALKLLIEHHVLTVTLLPEISVRNETYHLMYFGSLWSSDLLVAAIVGAVLLLSVVLNRLIEEPGRRFFKRVADRLERPLPAPAAASVADGVIG